MSVGEGLLRTRLVVSISTLGLAGCGAWALLTNQRGDLGQLTALLVAAAAIASLTLYDLDEALFLGGSLIANVCAIGLLRPAPAGLVALGGELAVFAVDRYRMSAFPMNLLGGVLPNMAGAALFEALIPQTNGTGYYLSLFGVAWVAILLNMGVVTSLVALERGEPVSARLRHLRPLLVPVGLNVLVAIGAVAVYRSEGLDGAIFLFGALLVFAYSAKQLTAQRRHLQRISSLAASRGRLVAQALEAEDRERRVVADALHDHVIQPLLALRQDLSSADLSRLAALLDSIDSTIAQLRVAIRATHPSVLERIGLAPALQAVAEYHAAQSRANVTVDIAPGLTTSHDRLLFSTARELLINAIKHANAAHVSIQAVPAGTGIRLTVVDDGVGWDLRDLTPLVASGHFGLASLSDRLEGVGGNLCVQKREGATGTTAIALIPDRASELTERPFRSGSEGLSVG